jgi:hypothetical protein
VKVAAKNRELTEPQFKVFCVENGLDLFWVQFEAWETKHFGAQEPEPGQEPEQAGGDPEGGEGEHPEGDPENAEGTALTPEVHLFSEQTHAIWNMVVAKGIPPLTLSEKCGVNSIGQITPENIDSVKAFVESYEPSKRGRGK